VNVTVLHTVEESNILLPISTGNGFSTTNR